MSVKLRTLAKHSHLGWFALIVVPALLGAKGCEIGVIGDEECGGLTGAQCGRGEFCDFDLDAQCGAADQTGTCRELPGACTLEFNPVCGCDGETYSNACSANAEGVSVASEGACEPEGEACGGIQGLACADGEFCDFAPDALCGAADQTGICREVPQACDAIFDPVCGCDDRTYGNECEAHLAGVSVASEGECGGAGGACGGLLGLSCADGEFCNFPPDAICGAADATGICEPIPDACIEIFAPVCGCDGETYANECFAHSAGVSVVSEGECEPQGQPCGGLQGLACADDEFCSFAPDAFCGAADATGVCQQRPEICADIFQPVCGCDGNTYGNACEANGAGVSVASEGECNSGGGATCGGLLGGGCADGEFCNFPPDAICGAADATGVCQDRPEICTLQFDPVCGCDGNTYGNSCEAAAAGVSVASEGECDSGGADCGGLLGLACADDEFCSFAPDAFCGAADATGTCVRRPEACTLQFDPVCGCDGNTYGNRCGANSQGISVASDGECE